MGKPEGTHANLCDSRGDCVFPSGKGGCKECPDKDVFGRFFTLPELAARDEAVRREALEEAARLLRHKCSLDNFCHQVEEPVDNDSDLDCIQCFAIYQILKDIRALAEVGKENKNG